MAHFPPESTNACPISPTTDIQPELRETGAPCDKCGKPIEVGQVVLCYDDAGEMHADCERPFALDYTREDGEPDPIVLLGSPMRHVALSRLTFTTPTLGDMVKLVDRLTDLAETAKRAVADSEGLADHKLLILANYGDLALQMAPAFRAALSAAPASPIPISVANEDKGNHDCLAKRRPDEPMFILLGRDPDAWQIVRAWANRRPAAGGDPEHCMMGLRTANAMRDYAADPANRPASAPPADAYPRLLTSVNGAGERGDCVAIVTAWHNDWLTSRTSGHSDDGTAWPTAFDIARRLDAALSPALDNTAVEGLTDEQYKPLGYKLAAPLSDWLIRNADRKNPSAFINTDPAYFGMECASFIAGIVRAAETEKA